MRNSNAADEGEETPVDELVGNAVKGDVEDLDTSSWADESDQGDSSTTSSKGKKSGGK